MVIELTPANIAYVVFRQRRVIIGCLLTCFLLTFIYSLLATSQYESDASVIVSFNRQLSGAAGTSQGASNAPSTSADTDEIVNSYVLVLESNALAESVIREIGLGKMYPKYVEPSVLGDVISTITKFLGVYKTPLERAVYHFVNKDTDIQVAKNSTVIQIVLYNRSPDIAKQALDVFINKFLTQQAQIGRDPQLSFVRNQAEVYRRQVAETQQAMEAFQTQNNISSMDEENSYLLKQRSDLEEQLDQNKLRIEDDQHKSAALSTQLRTLSETVDLRQEDRDAALDAARMQLVQLQVRQETLGASFGPDSPVTRNVDSQIEKMQSFISAYPNRGALLQRAPNPTYQVIQSALLQTQADLDAALKARPVIQHQMEAISARLMERAHQQTAYQDLVRDYQIGDENYRTYLQAVQQARIADDLNKEKASSVAVYDPPYLASSLPTKPKTSLIVVAGIVLGLILGLSSAFLRETWDERLNTPRQVNKVLGLPVLGSMTILANSGTPDTWS